MRLRLSYYFWLTACLLALVILYHSHLKAVQSFSKSYQAIPKDDSQRSRAGYETSTSSSVITAQETDNVIFTESPPLNPNEIPAGSTPSDRIIVVGMLISEDTTWVEEELSELVFSSSNNFASLLTRCAISQLATCHLQRGQCNRATSHARK